MLLGNSITLDSGGRAGLCRCRTLPPGSRKPALAAIALRRPFAPIQPYPTPSITHAEPLGARARAILRDGAND
jgi:hypothetical protein